MKSAWQNPTLDGFSGVFWPRLMSTAGKTFTLQIGALRECCLLSPESLVLPTVILLYSSEISQTLPLTLTFKAQSFLLHITYRCPPLPTNRSANQSLSTFFFPSFPLVSVKEVFSAYLKLIIFLTPGVPVAPAFSETTHYVLSFLHLQYLPLLVLAQQILNMLLTKLSSCPSLPTSLHRLISLKKNYLMTSFILVPSHQ